MNQNKTMHLDKNIEVIRTNEFASNWSYGLGSVTFANTKGHDTDALGTRFSKRICNVVSRYATNFIPHFFCRCYVRKDTDIYIYTYFPF
jgi:hypothetical protein